MSIIDIHSHILPALDDGAKSLNEALGALREAKKQGIDEIILTPHHYPDHMISVDLIVQAKEILDEAIRENDIGIQIYLGQECLYHTELPALLDSGEVLTLAESKYVLVEFLEDASFREILCGMRQLKEAGYEPILAHYERYRSLMQKGRILKLKNEDVLLQMNLDTVQRQYGILKRNPFQEDLKKGYVDFMASDCHGMKFRKYYIEPSVGWMEKNLPRDYMERILFKNPKKILEHTY